MRNRLPLWRIPRVTILAFAGALPVVLALAVAPPAAAFFPVAPRTSATPSPKASTTPYTTTLANVRSIIGANTGSATSLNGRGIGIALIDTGVTPVLGIPAFQLVNGPDLSVESQATNLRYLDTYGHGTHMAGIMVARDLLTGTKGLAYDAKLTSIKIGTATGATDVTQAMAAIDWVVKHRNDDSQYPIRVINLSYGSGGNPSSWNDPLQYAAEQAWKAGIVVVAAAGNQGNGYGRLTDPASDPWVISVGATTTNGTIDTTDDTAATFTNLDPNRGIDIWAPGDSIASLRVPNSNIDLAHPTARVGDTLFKGTGTSQATAVVSAAAALLLQYKPTLTPGQVKSYLKNSAQHIRNFNVGYHSYSLDELNVNQAITLIAADAKKSASPGTPNPWNPGNMWGNGRGKIEDARGTTHMYGDSTKLVGERTLFGPLSTDFYAIRAGAQSSWTNGVWMGYRMAGDDWTGISLASRTWAAATWPTTPWYGNGSWTDPSWSGRYWSGRYWSATSWTGRYWSDDNWSTDLWQ